MNVHIQKASSMILIEAIMLSIIFLSVMLSLNYLLDWYFIENKNALIDDLTEVYNRKGINFFFRKEIERAERLKHPLSVAMVDIDHFKVYNDSSGHLRGDWLLKAIAKILKMNFRELDIVGRYGGEEFLVILPETGQDHAVIATERIRGLIERTKFPRMELQPEKKVTVSIGLATFNKSFDETNMVHKADSLLYMAKQKGRNRVVYNEYD
jgi:diguanylate cyclase (GGDEF)-like protein